MPWSTEYAAYFSKHDNKIISHGKPIFSIEEKIFTTDGNLITLVTDKYPLYDDNKVVIGIVGISSDPYDRDLNNQIYLENIIERIPYYIFWKNTN